LRLRAGRRLGDNEETRSMSATILRLAARNCFRHRRRTATALAAIAGSVIALLLAGGFVEWVLKATREAAIQTGLGHVTIMRPGYREHGIADPFSFLLPEPSSQRAAIEKVPEVAALAPRLNVSGLISLGEASMSFVGTGVDPERESQVSRILYITEGEPLSADHPRDIIVGRGLAGALGIRPGARVILFATSSTGGPNAVEVTVRGIFSTDAKAYDDVAIRLPIEVARELVRVKGSHEWVLSLDRTEATGRIVSDLRERYAADKLQFAAWYELADFYNKTSELLTSQMNVIRLIIGTIIVFSISNTFIMGVLERTGEIGTMMALGTPRRRILGQFVSEGMVLGASGALIGLVAGLVLAWAISSIGIPMPPPPGRSAGYTAQLLMTWPLVAGSLAIAAGTTLLASLYPAWKASRLAIVDALRHNR
jgi:putative ABC transport system permease protein